MVLADLPFLYEQTSEAANSLGITPRFEKLSFEGVSLYLAEADLD